MTECQGCSPDGDYCPSCWDDLMDWLGWDDWQAT